MHNIIWPLAAGLPQVGTGSRSEKIKTYNYKDSRVSDHRSKSNFALDGVLAGDLDDCIDTMVVLDQQEQLQVKLPGCSHFPCTHELCCARLLLWQAAGL